jgi:transposase InsO family protein
MEVSMTRWKAGAKRTAGRRRVAARRSGARRETKSGASKDPRQRRYSGEVKAKAVAWAKKHGNAEAAAKFGMTEKSVGNWRKAAGEVAAATRSKTHTSKRRTKGATKHPSQRRYSREVKAAAVAWAKKHGNAAAAVKFGTTDESVRNWRKAADSSKPGTRASATRDVRAAEGRKSSSAKKGRRYGAGEKKEILEYADEHGPSEAAATYQVSRWSIYDWKQRREKAQREGKKVEAALRSRSSRPKRNANKISEDRYRLIATTWKKNRALGPRQVSQLVRRNHGLRVGTATCRRVMEDYGYVPPKIRVERKEVRRYEAVRPNQQHHFDFIQFWIHKVKVFLLLLEDDYSRFVTGWCLCEGERAAPVIETTDEAIARHGKPEQIVVDAGSGFFSWKGQSQLERLCEDYGIDFIKATKVGGNAKIEALNGSVRRELLQEEEFADVADARQKIPRWIRFYNLERPHQGLGGLLVPADRYWGRVAEVLAQLERGEPVVAPEPSSPDVRTLDMFRVVSRNGQPEIWLMGLRVWPPESR